MTATLTGTAHYVKDLTERVVSTFLVAFLGTLITGGWFDVTGIRNVSAVQAAALAGAAAVLSLVKGLVGKAIGNPDSASVVPGV
jgi:Putative lactococcus lactis phage r1t holin